MAPEDAAVITAELQKLRVEVAGIAKGLDQAQSDVSEVKQLAKAINGRVRALELWRAKAEGALAAAGLVKPVVYAVVGIMLGVLSERFLS